MVNEGQNVFYTKLNITNFINVLQIYSQAHDERKIKNFTLFINCDFFMPYLQLKWNKLN